MDGQGWGRQPTVLNRITEEGWIMYLRANRSKKDEQLQTTIWYGFYFKKMTIVTNIPNKNKRKQNLFQVRVRPMQEAIDDYLFSYFPWNYPWRYRKDFFKEYNHNIFNFLKSFGRIWNEFPLNWNWILLVKWELWWVG